MKGLNLALLKNWVPEKKKEYPWISFHKTYENNIIRILWSLLFYATECTAGLLQTETYINIINAPG